MHQAIAATAAHLRRARRTLWVSGLLIGVASLGFGAVAFAGKAMLPATGVERGAALFDSHCATCHAARLGAPRNIGPNLFRVVGRRAGTLPGYRYSASMSTSGTMWSAATLDAYLADPRETAPAGRMPHPGLKTDAERADVVGYLETLK
jgi:cytochrome c2